MSTMTQRATHTLVSGINTSLGCTMPKAVEEAAALAEDFARGGFTPPAVDEVVDAIFDARAAGRDALADPDVIRLATARALSQQLAPGFLAERAVARVTQAYRENADQIIEAWSQPFDDAAQALAAAVPVLGDFDLDDHAALLKRGGDVAARFVAVLDAEKTIRTVVDGWIHLAHLRGVTVNPHRVIVVADVPHDEILEHGLGGNPRPWEVARAGYALKLPATLADYRARSLAAVAPPTPTEADRWRQERAHGAAEMQKAYDRRGRITTRA